MRKIFSLILCLLSFPAFAEAPIVRYVNPTNGTIGATNTYQSVLPLNKGRYSCAVQNNGTHNMFVYADQTGASSAPVTNNNLSITLVPGAVFNCGNPGTNSVLGDEIWLTGTANDTFVVWAQ